MTASVGYTTTTPLPSPGTADDRALHAFRELVRACLPQLALLGLWDYRIESMTGAIATCSPVNPSLGLPGAISVTLTPSILGESVVLPAGARIVVAFLDGNAAKPVAIAGDPSTTPVSAKICNGTLGAARVSDPVDAGYLSGVVTGSNVTFTYMKPGGAPVTATTVTLSGVISGGSGKVLIG